MALREDAALRLAMEKLNRKEPVIKEEDPSNFLWLLKNKNTGSYLARIGRYIMTSENRQDALKYRTREDAENSLVKLGRSYWDLVRVRRI